VPGRVLGVDWGEKRFGVALSDPLRMIAQPLTTLTRRPKQRPPVGAIAALAAEHGATAIVVGLPLTMEGDEGDAARAARALGAALAARTGLPVHYLDERMTTAHALKSARRAGVRDEDSRGRIDQMAAVGILQAWLDREGRGTGGPGDGGTA
jgi:putative Holliday junction resolvase